MHLEIGQRVVFRSLQWEVADNASDAYVGLFGRDRLNLGQRVRAIPGLEAIERAQPPELEYTIGAAGWNPTLWKALHDAFRLTLSHGRGNLSTVDWGRLILEPYQLVPLQRIENLPFPRLLIADDTGLGKTAEAGLILFRLMQRRRAERILVLCRARPEPERWAQELQEKFGIEAEVINDGQDYARLRRKVPAHLNVFAYVPRLIMSMHFAAQPHVLDDLRHDVRWDVTIIDEAHHLAERGSGRKRLWELAQVICGKSDSDPLLLLTATPHDGKGESFASLIRLLDPYAVVDPDRLDPAIVRPLVVRRLKTQVVKADGTRFLRRQIIPLDVEPYRSKAERSLERGLRDYTAQLRKRAEQLAAAGERNRAMGASFLETFLRKRLSSSVYALHQSLVNRLDVVRGKPLPPESEDVTDDHSQAALAAEAGVLPDGRTEEEVLLGLIARAEKIPEGDEAKVRALIGLLEARLAAPDEKVIIFTEFVDTLTMLARVLDHSSWASQYVTYSGETKPKDRDDTRLRFLKEPQFRIFLATDAASEGINLQETCRILIHVEVPWNPNRYEQRNGRIDRYGQAQRPEVYLLVATKSLEQRVAQVVAQKLETIADQVGSVSNVFPLMNKVDIDEFLSRADADAVETAAEEIEKQLDKAIEESVRELEEAVSGDLLRGEGFEAAEMAAIDLAMAEARTLVPEYQEVEEFLRAYFQADSGEGGALGPTDDEGIYRVAVPRGLRAEVGDVESYPRATFRRDIAVAEKDRESGRRVEFLSPGHPLVRAALRRMRGKVYSPGFASRVSFRRVGAAELPGYLFSFAMRFVDGRGEAIEERFEPVFVNLNGLASLDPEADRRQFVLASEGNLTPDERRTLTAHFKADFERAREAAQTEALRRQTERTQELVGFQERIAEDALIRLGRWEQASKERLQSRMETSGASGAQQFDLFGVVARRLRQFQKEQEQLLRQKETRRAEIRSMKQVRADSLDAIGALALFPAGFSG